MFNFLKQHTFLLSLLVVASVAAAFLEGLGVALVFPLFQTDAQMAIGYPLSKIFTRLLSLPLDARLQRIGVLLFVAILLKNVFIYWSYLLSTRLQLIVTKHFRIQCIDELMRAGMAYFNKQRISDFQLIVDGYTDTAAGAIVGLIGQAMPQLFTTIVLLVFLFFLSWKLTVVSLILVVFVSLVVNKLSRNILYASKIVYEARADFNRSLLDIINGMKLIRLFNREKFMCGKFDGHIDAFNKARYKASALVGMVAPSFEIAGIGTLALILITGSFFIKSEGHQWLGVLFTFVIILSRMIGPVKILNHARATVLEKIPLAQEILRLLSPKDKHYVVSGSKVFESLREGIEFCDVSFQYEKDSPCVLDSMSFSIPKASQIGIVGPSGAGKSTIFELLLRFYDPQKGTILIDGVRLDHFDIFSWRRRIGVVSQDIFLFNDTVRTNIAFADPDAPFKKIQDAAQKAYAHEFIEGLPQGYDTVIGERGILLSGGQRQRLAIARAIMADPEIIVFDEATSALDSESEQFIQKAMDGISHGKTVIVIAHRFSTIIDSDKILVIDQGKIVEEGRHGELIQQNGLYAKFVKMQELESEIKEEEKRLGGSAKVTL